MENRIDWDQAGFNSTIHVGQCIFFLFMKQVVDLLILDSNHKSLSLENVAIVLEFGALVSGLGSIYFSRRR